MALINERMHSDWMSVALPGLATIHSEHLKSASPVHLTNVKGRTTFISDSKKISGKDVNPKLTQDM